MAHDIMAQFYTCLNLPLHTKIIQLTRLIDDSGPSKDLQTLFPQLIDNIFSSSFGNGWYLRTITYETDRFDFENLTVFLGPQGPLFRLCYKLMSDPQLKYNLPLNVVPLDLQMTLEQGRCPQFYADMLTIDSQSLKVAALALNPFDYYIVNFALHLLNTNHNKSSWENWNNAYFALACDYLMHFLPSDPNIVILPQIPNYSGKVPMAAPLQTANRPLGSPSLLLIPDLLGLNNQPTSPQNQSRNEVWRTETVLQIFIDLWMSVEPFGMRNIEMYQRNYPTVCSTPERVRIVRVLVKHIHSFSAKHLSDRACRSSSLRKYSRQLMCARAHHYIKHLVTTWPLDTSFRLVLELWLSLIQPWRYIDNTINQDRFPNNNQEEGNTNNLDASFIQFIAENFPSYTCIFKLVIPRFMRLDLTAYKNAVMLFRLGKVFSQQHLVPILCKLERAIVDSKTTLDHSTDASFNNNTSVEQRYSYNGIGLHKWVAIAKQAISEMSLSLNFEYDPVWNDDNKHFEIEFVTKILSAKLAAEKNIQELDRKLSLQQKGVWGSIKCWLMIGNEDKTLLEENQKVPTYLNSAVHNFTKIFGLSERTVLAQDPVVEDSSMENSSFANSSSFPQNITNKLRHKPTDIQYMGDPDLKPITSYESTILVRMLYQISSRLNEMYRDQFTSLWNRNNFCGYVAREVLQQPCVIQTYVKDVTNHQSLVCEELPARLSLRQLGSHSFVAWVTVGYIIFKLFSLSGLCYVFVLFVIWLSIVLIKATLKMFRFIRQ